MNTQYRIRQIEPLFLRHLKSFPVVAVSGARQTGKTTLIKHLLSKTYDFKSLDNLDTRRLAITDPKKFVEDLKDYTIIDEIQYAPDILSYIKLRVDNDRDKRGNFVLTGSQQFLVMKGLTETLAGRIGIMDLYPFTAIETETGKINTLDIFTKHALVSSYPEPLLAPEADIGLWYNNYIRVYLERDVSSLYNIGSLSEFETFMKLLALRTAQPLNMSAIAAEAGVSVVTIKKWISILQASGIIYLLRPYHANIKKRFVKSPKAYFIDTALACRLCGIKSHDGLFTGGLLGQMFENFCVIEAFKQNSNSGAGNSMFFLRVSSGLEVDLLIENSGGFTQFEIKASKSIPSGAADNMLNSIKNIFPKGKVKDSFVVTFNDDIGSAGGGVNYCGLETLLEKSGDMREKT